LLLLVAATAVPAVTQQPADTIDRVVVLRRSVFDPDETTFWLLRAINSLHITTQPYVVRRELLFRAGERFDSARVAETERNLRRLGVFRTVSIDSTTTDSGMVVTVTTHDGWSTRPDLRFRSTGEDVAYTIALIEDNLLGTASQAQVLYNKTPDRTTTTLGFRQQRLINNEFGLTGRYENRSDGDLLAGVFSKPFFSMSSRRSWSLEFDTRNERILQFRAGIKEPTDTLRRRHVLARAGIGTALRASTAGYLRAGVAMQVRRDDFADHSLASVSGIPGREVTGAVGAWVESRQAKFAKLRGYNNLSREEDIDLSTVLRAEVWLAPEVLGYQRNGIGPEVLGRIGTRLPWGFGIAEARANGLFSSAGLDSGSVQLGATMAWLPSDKHLAVFHVSAGALHEPVPGSEFDLGFGAGPRGFNQHAFTGDRMIFATAEYRYGLAADFLKVMDLGVATFVDVGGAWYEGEAVRTGWDLGVGLRISASRAPDLESNRIDLVRRMSRPGEPGEWLLVVAKGFAFSSALRGGR
jgi:hypothetical protein